MGDIVNLRSTPIDLNTDAGQRFVVDATRAAEGLISDRELAEKYELSPADWQSVATDVAVGRAIRAQREKRVLDGTAARESAAKHFVRAPTILAGIMENQLSNPRHVIEAAREIRAVAASGDTDSSTQSEKFLIVINLGEDCVTRREFDLVPNKSRQLEDTSDADE